MTRLWAIDRRATVHETSGKLMSIYRFSSSEYLIIADAILPPAPLRLVVKIEPCRLWRRCGSSWSVLDQSFKNCTRNTPHEFSTNLKPIDGEPTFHSVLAISGVQLWFCDTLYVKCLSWPTKLLNSKLCFFEKCPWLWQCASVLRI